MPHQLDEILALVPFFEGMAEDQIALIAGCGQNVHFDEGETIFRQGDAADNFFVVRHGTVAVGNFVPPRGELVIETLEAGDLLGWSWLFPPYRSHFDARALSSVRATQFDGACLRDKCAADPGVRLRAHEPLRAGADRAPAVDAAPAPGHLWRRLPSLRTAPPAPSSRSRSGWPTAAGTRSTRGRSRSSPSASGFAVAPGQFVMVYAFGVGEVPISVSGPPERPGEPVVLTVRDVGAVTHAICAAEAGARARACAALSATAGRCEAAEGGDVVVVAGRDRARAAAPGRRSTRSRGAATVRRGVGALRRAHAGRPALHRRAGGLGATCSGWR